MATTYSHFLVLCLLTFFTLSFARPTHFNLSKLATHWEDAVATWYGSPDGFGSDGGSCGYGNSVSQAPFSSMVTGIGPSLYNGGKECGACYHVKCTKHPLCSRKATRVVITDFCQGGPYASDHAHFDLSGTAFGSMAKPGQEKRLRDAGVLQIQFASVENRPREGATPSIFIKIDIRILTAGSGREKCNNPRRILNIHECIFPPSIEIFRSRLVMKWEDIELGDPKDGEIRVKNKAIGVNFIDVYFRKGVYKAAAIPFTPGMEAVGVVTAVGPGLTGRQVGDIVAYAGTPMGAYAEEQILPADKVVPVPSSVDPSVAASVMLKGMTAQFLLCRCFKVECGHTILVHAAAGGVGSLLCQWANKLGATVIGTVSTKEKAAQAKEDGCHHVIVSKEENFVERVTEITSGEGVEVVYDSVGKDTFEGSLACLKIRGHLVSFGQSSGAPDPVPLSALAVKSLFLTRPSLMQYTAKRDELLEAAGEVFANIATGVLRVRVNHKYPLSQASQAHLDLESRKTTGSIVLIPDGVEL
ncbi:groES-like zinc-binding alcohol dehydrogenase family protein [Artemisia annua]|uniref:Probable quinone oxidoreductase n=1 Tax=Artemisia annua TaxID=35608 RepID=A0A2U1NX95_ARTAN|nr:groES-like zinc-binding alcohol dehydrogenase family protein [Artemisia annua]